MTTTCSATSPHSRRSARRQCIWKCFQPLPTTRNPECGTTCTVSSYTRQICAKVWVCLQSSQPPTGRHDGPCIPCNYYAQECLHECRRRFSALCGTGGRLVGDFKNVGQWTAAACSAQAPTPTTPLSIIASARLSVLSPPGICDLTHAPKSTFAPSLGQIHLSRPPNTCRSLLCLSTPLTWRRTIRAMQSLRSDL